MRIGLSASDLEFQAELRRYLDGLDTDAVEAELDDDPMDIGPEATMFMQQLGRDGWLGINWPADCGGRGLSAIAQWLFLEEMNYRCLPYGALTTSSIGPTLTMVGNEAQNAEYLPQFLAGRLIVAIGYTEPDAGTDLASLRTRAVRDGDEYVIDGQKVFTTFAHKATHLWLAARTGAPDSKHKGLSIFILPMDAPGITVTPIYTQADEQTNEVFLNGVRVPATNLVGGENRGWDVITVQLNFERLFSHAELRREFEFLVQWAGDTGRLDGTHPESQAVRQSLAELAADLEVARLFSLRAAFLIAQGEVPYIEASMNKVWYSELRQRVALKALDLMGEEGQLRVHQEAAPLGGRMERYYRASTVLKFGAGTNEVQRNIIAQRGLGLPR